MVNNSVIGFNLCKTEINTNYITSKLCANLQMNIKSKFHNLQLEDLHQIRLIAETAFKDIFSFMNEEINKNFIISMFLWIII